MPHGRRAIGVEKTFWGNKVLHFCCANKAMQVRPDETLAFFFFGWGDALIRLQYFILLSKTLFPWRFPPSFWFVPFCLLAFVHEDFSILVYSSGTCIKECFCVSYFSLNQSPSLFQNEALCFKPG